MLFLALCLVESGVLHGSDKRMLTYADVMLTYADVSSRAACCVCCVSAKASFACFQRMFGQGGVHISPVCLHWSKPVRVSGHNYRP
jgi:hypothetical protein